MCRANRGVSAASYKRRDDGRLDGVKHDTITGADMKCKLAN